MSRTFAYTRVSTPDQTTQNQIEEIKAAGFEIAKRHLFCDIISGSTLAAQRPQFSALLNKLDEGDTLVVSKLDRLGRDAIDIQQTLRNLERLGVSVIVLALGKTDLTSSAGKLIVGVLAQVAEMERDLIVERTRAGLARAKAEGKQLGRPNAVNAEDVKRLRAEGSSIAGTAEQLGCSIATVKRLQK